MLKIAASQLRRWNRSTVLPACHRPTRLCQASSSKGKRVKIGQQSDVFVEHVSNLTLSNYNLLEGSFTVLVVNAHHMHNVPGRKTDVKLRHEVAFVAVETA